jgi:hypothetical protein
VVRDQNDKWKVEGTECTRLTKLTTHFWLTKDVFGDNKTNNNKKNKDQIWHMKKLGDKIEKKIKFYKLF